MSTATSGLPPLAAEDHVCDSCSLAYTDLTLADAVAEIRELPDAVRAAVAAVPTDRRRLRPGSGVWSVTEYVCHVRDVFVGFTIRLRRARTEDEPVVDPMFGDLRAVRFRYAHADLGAVLDELGRAAAGFRDEIAGNRPEEGTRTIPPPPREGRTPAWVGPPAPPQGRHH